MEEEKKQKIKSSTTIIIITMIGIVICLAILGIYIKHKLRSEKCNTDIALLGKQEVILEVGNEYKDDGFIAKSNNKNINDKVKVSSNVNTKTLGKYEVVYNLSIDYLGVNKTLSRQVYIKDTTKPELKIDSEKEKTIYIGDKYTYPQYTAIDNYDGDITDKVKVESNINLKQAGTYEINYLVSDSSGNEATDTIIVHVKKKKNPYVVVSISKQTLKYYEYDNVVLSSNIVTGKNNRTPTGNFKVLNKARNIVLKGKDYESFVNYWIAFKGSSFGFHDASWRNSFGGKIYINSGSHGCVNMPYNKVKQLYNMISIGTPVYIKK